MKVREGLTCLTLTDGSQNISEQDNTWCTRNQENVCHLTGVNLQNSSKSPNHMSSSTLYITGDPQPKGEEPTNKKPKSPACLCCNEPHPLYKCNEFKRKSVLERYELAKSFKVCFNCLKQGREVDKCLNKTHCQVTNCKRHHHSLLHYERATPQPPLSQDPQAQPPLFPGNVLTKVATTNSPAANERVVYFKVVPVQIQGENGKAMIETFAFLDHGSSDTLIKKDTADKLNLEGPERLLCLGNVENNGTPQCSKAVNLLVTPTGKQAVNIPVNIHPVWTVPRLNVPPQRLDKENFRRTWKHLEDRDIPTVSSYQIGLLIGVQVTEAIIQHEHRREDASNFRSDLGHYETGLLWKDEKVMLLSNRPLAEKRLTNLERSLDKDSERAKAYYHTVDTYTAKAYARKSSPTEIVAKEPKNTWYLPHHAVTNPNKPEKVRVVFDAAASYKGTSLNDQLVTGPDLLNPLVGVIMRFRLHAVAMIADIEAMFFQVRVIEKDQASLRFLWRGPNRDHTPSVYQMQAMIFGAKLSPTSANYCLKRTAVDNQNTSSEEATSTVLRDFYMYDLLKSLPSEAKTAQLALQLIELLSSDGFRLTSLPQSRLQAFTPPFYNTRVDYFGPWSVKERRSTVKRYGYLFTCLVTRAVHLEIAPSLETDSFIMALRRMMARRGKPRNIYSDNGTNFVGVP
ncbi:hypothetical protein AWC38_SpisGene8168 [Stylophora pistillata]|uniref:Integrase catalytic domain-containing protein n=1 Tax=Stylophora pistillata TaxID=50429 RepID=A0A2B4SDF8_STYPI|nr:hypothetical protein AWC38_SpisGene8168 [Stylophora pistillata]